MHMLKIFVHVSGIITYSFISILKVFQVLERFNRSKVGSSDSIIALPTSIKGSDLPKLSIDMQHYG